MKDDPKTGKRVVAGTHWDFDSYGGTIKKQLGMPTQVSPPFMRISFVFFRSLFTTVAVSDMCDMLNIMRVMHVQHWQSQQCWLLASLTHVGHIL